MLALGALSYHLPCAPGRVDRIFYELLPATGGTHVVGRRDGVATAPTFDDRGDRSGTRFGRTTAPDSRKPHLLTDTTVPHGRCEASAMRAQADDGWTYRAEPQPTRGPKRSLGREHHRKRAADGDDTGQDRSLRGADLVSPRQHFQHYYRARGPASYHSHMHQAGRVAAIRLLLGALGIRRLRYPRAGPAPTLPIRTTS